MRNNNRHHDNNRNSEEGEHIEPYGFEIIANYNAINTILVTELHCILSSLACLLACFYFYFVVLDDFKSY